MLWHSLTKSIQRKQLIVTCLNGSSLRLATLLVSAAPNLVTLSMSLANGQQLVSTAEDYRVAKLKSWLGRILKRDIESRWN